VLLRKVMAVAADGANSTSLTVMVPSAKSRSPKPMKVRPM